MSLHLLCYVLTLTCFLHHVTAQQNGPPCQPCGDGYEMTTPNASFDAGVESLKCRDLISIAADRPFGTDVCYLVMNYALEHCQCKDENGNSAPDLPYYDSTVPCNICGGRWGSDLWTTDPALSELSVDTGIGLEVKCGFLFTTGLEGAFSSDQCSNVQSVTRKKCGCALRDFDGGNPNNSPSSEGGDGGGESDATVAILSDNAVIAIIVVMAIALSVLWIWIFVRIWRKCHQKS